MPAEDTAEAVAETTADAAPEPRPGRRLLVGGVPA